MEKLHILKLTDRDDRNSDEQYFTIKSLRERVLMDWYDVWSENKQEPEDYTKEHISDSDEDLFSWLEGWGYNIEIVYTVTELDLYQTIK